MSYYPPPGFHFAVRVPSLPPSAQDACFTDGGGLSMEAAAEEVPEGGENRFVQKYPVRAKYPELTLKRGLLVGSEVHDWVRQGVDDLRIQPMNVDVKLLNENHRPLMTWHLVRAWPTKWAVSD